MKQVFRCTRVSGKDAVLQQESPQALCLCAPLGCGKTYVMKTAMDQFDMNSDEAVLADNGQLCVRCVLFHIVGDSGFVA